MNTEIQIKVKNCPLIPINKLEIIQGNLKELSKVNYDKLKDRIARLGFDAPIFVWKGKVLDGTQRIRTVQKMIEDGYSLPGNKLPIVEIQAKDINEAKERLLGYISQFGKVTDEGLYEFIQGLDIDFGSLDLPDFNMDKFKIGWFEKEIAQTGEDDIPEIPKKAKSKRGQIYQLDKHKVMCGDSTCREDVDKLMNGKRADMVFTDPPYGINKEIINDDLKEDDWLNFYRQFTDNFLLNLKDNGYFYVWGYFDGLSRYWEQIIKPQGKCNFRNFIIWQKSYIQGINSPEFRQLPENYAACLLCIYGQPFQNGAWSVSPNAEHYWNGFDPIRKYLDKERKKMGWDIPTVKKMIGHSDLSRDHWFGKSQWSFPTREVYETLQKNAKKAFRKEYNKIRREYDDLRGYFDNTNGWTDVWKLEKLTTTDKHPTVKPIEICERGIITTSNKNDLVLDSFLGSGSTLIACEKTNRICYGMEIDPIYVDVIIKRWEDYTGKKAKLLPKGD